LSRQVEQAPYYPVLNRVHPDFIVCVTKVPAVLKLRLFQAINVLIALLVAVPCARAQQEQQGPPPARVRVGTLESQQMQARWDVIGRLVERKRSIIAAEQEGRIIELNVNVGDVVVARKTVLAKIDDVWASLNVQQYKAQLEEAQATKREAESQLEQTQRDLAFYEDLAAKRSAKPKEVDDARTASEVAQARLAASNANLQQKKIMLERAEEQLDRLTVRAPFDGVVVRKRTELGQWVNTGDAVIELISIGQIEAHVDVPESLVNNLTTNDVASLKIDPLNLETQGKIIAIIPDAASAARTFPVHVLLDNPDGALKAGMSVTAHIPTSETKAFLTVPRNAVLTTSLGSVIWANLQGKAMRIDVQILFGTEDRYVIKPAMPLEAGTQVVIEGAERLFPTQPLEILNP
jgi:RND family efflux transporter MFP subunit